MFITDTWLNPVGSGADVFELKPPELIVQSYPVLSGAGEGVEFTILDCHATLPSVAPQVFDSFWGDKHKEGGTPCWPPVEEAWLNSTSRLFPQLRERTDCLITTAKITYTLKNLKQSTSSQHMVATSAKTSRRHPYRVPFHHTAHSSFFLRKKSQHI